MTKKSHDLHLHPISQRALVSIATSEAGKKIKDIEYSSAWASDTTTAASRASLYTKIESIGGTSDLWTSQAGLETSGDDDIIFRKLGQVGIGPTLVGNIASGMKLHVVGNTLLEGNLQVDGTTTYVNTTQLQIGDNIMELNADLSGSTSPTQDSGMLVNRGNATDVQLYWKESVDKWHLTDASSNDYFLWHSGLNTDSVGEGSTNLYYTDARAVSAMGSKANANALNHDRYTDANAISAVEGEATLALTGDVTIGSVGSGKSLTVTNVSATGVSISGHLEATTKSFNIPHPLYKNKKLIHGSLEGPEFGLYCRGMGAGVASSVVELPDYWRVLAHKDYTVILTPKGPYAVYLKSKLNDSFVVESTNKGMFGKKKAFEFEYLVVGERTDATLEVIRDG